MYEYMYFIYLFGYHQPSLYFNLHLFYERIHKMENPPLSLFPSFLFFSFANTALAELNNFSHTAGILVETVPQHFPTKDNSGSYDSYISESSSQSSNSNVSICVPSKMSDESPSFQVSK